MNKTGLLPRFLVAGVGIALIFFALAHLTSLALREVSMSEYKRMVESKGLKMPAFDHPPGFGEPPPPHAMVPGLPPPPPPPPPFGRVVVTQGLALVGAVFLTIFIMIWTLRSKARMAEMVIADLRKGNLKARFPVTRMDEIGNVMSSFNTMADEVERLIESLRATEASRRNLLRELAHDLRTPIASMKTLVETVGEAGETLGPEKRLSLLRLVLAETKYFETLVDDLLFLGRVDEPGYRSTDQKFEIRHLVEDEIGPIEARYPGRKGVLEMKESIEVSGDPQLVRRLLRNGLENAFSFARSSVKIEISETQREVTIRILDDGPGFGLSEIETFGQKKFSRTVQARPVSGEKRISVGLGAVIMKAIAEAHRGRIRVGNRVENDKIVGAEVTITFPK